MDHTLANQTNTIDKYLLNELTPEERQSFEAHVFDCPECAAKVRADFEMIEDLKEVLGEPAIRKAESFQSGRGWREWLRPMTLGPAFAALALACVTGYQNMVTIPAMFQLQDLDEATFVAGPERGAAKIVSVKPGAPFFEVNFDVSSHVLPSYLCEFQGDGKGTIATQPCGKERGDESNLALLLPSKKFPPGEYTLILRPATDPHGEVTRVSFGVKVKTGANM
jgi:hypothetical protein